jgi:hypothetical protein
MTHILSLDTDVNQSRKQRPEEDGCTLRIFDASSSFPSEIAARERIGRWFSAANKLWEELVELNEAQHPKTGRYLDANELQKLTKGLKLPGLDEEELAAWDELPARTKQYIARHVYTAFVQFTTAQGRDKDGLERGVRSLIFDGSALPKFRHDSWDGSRLFFLAISAQGGCEKVLIAQCHLFCHCFPDNMSAEVEHGEESAAARSGWLLSEGL